MGYRAESLRPGDIAVALELAMRPGQSYEQLAHRIGISTSAAHRAVRRLESAQLLVPGRRKVMLRQLRNFLAHGVRHAFFAEPGPEAVGIPTAHSAPPLSTHVSFERHYVWPSPVGRIRGAAVTPLYRRAADLPVRNPELYEALTLVDAIRVGRTRERKEALRMLSDLLRRRAPE